MDVSKEIFLRTFVKALHRHMTFGQTPNLTPLFIKRKGTFVVRELDAGYIPMDDASQMQRLRQLQGTHLETIKRLGEVVEARDHFTEGHTDHLRVFARRLSQELGWRTEKQEELEIGTYLHDIGKVSISEEILNKEGGLTKKEFKHVLRHPQVGAALLRSVDFLQPVIPFVLYHHERFDGDGYPYGLVGKRIPLEGRVMAVLDTYVNLISARSYHAPMDPEEAIADLETQANKKLDPEIVEAFISAVRQSPA